MSDDPIHELARLRYSHNPLFTADQEQWEMDEFDRWFNSKLAGAFDEALELLENDSTIDREILEHYKQINPYRKDQTDD